MLKEPYNVHDLKFTGIRAWLQAWLLDDPDHLASFPGLVFDHKYRRRRPGESYHVIHGMTDVMDPRHNSLFTFVSIATL